MLPIFTFLKPGICSNLINGFLYGRLKNSPWKYTRWYNFRPRCCCNPFPLPDSAELITEYGIIHGFFHLLCTDLQKKCIYCPYVTSLFSIQWNPQFYMHCTLFYWDMDPKERIKVTRASIVQPFNYRNLGNVGLFSS